MNSELNVRDFLNVLLNVKPKINLDPDFVFSSLSNLEEIKDLNSLSEKLAYLSSNEPDFSLLAGRVETIRLHKATSPKFSQAILSCKEILDPFFVEVIQNNSEIIDKAIIHTRDYMFDYFSLKTLQKSYLIRHKGQIVERPQYMFMRISVFLYPNDLNKAFELYNDLSEKYYIFATPTLFNSGLKFHQLCSCFLIDIKDDSISGIYDTLKDCALISKNSGGIGLAIHKIRGKNTVIKGTGGYSNGIVPMLRVFNETARYVDQCFDKNTLLYTERGWLEIQLVQIGDKVLTRDGTFQKVINKKVFDYHGPAYMIFTDIGLAFVTPKHPILILDSDGYQRFVEVEKLGVGTKLPVPKLQYGCALDLKNVTDFTDFLGTNTSSSYKSIDSISTQSTSNLNNPKDPHKKQSVNSNQIITIKNISMIENFYNQMYDLVVENNHNYFTVIGTAHNGGGRRKGAIAVYLEPWHSDIFDFLQMKRNTGKEEFKARDLFYALWIPDLFMKRVYNNETWSLFSPDDVKDLYEKYGEDFEKAYEEYEKHNIAKATVKAKELWDEIIKTQIETGGPFMLYKDTCNRCSNQKNLGTIKSSNLCTEIIEYSDPDNIAVCNLASISLPNFVDQETKTINYQKLEEVTRKLVRHLNKIIDINLYPNEQSRNSNMKNRPIGIGVQGLADVFMKLKIPYTSPEARKINIEIFKCMYLSALKESVKMSKELHPYFNFQGSPSSKGLINSLLFNENRLILSKVSEKIPVYDSACEKILTNDEAKRELEEISKKIKKHGLYNSLFIALMPTASTSQLLGNTESFEPLYSNIFVRRTLSGDFTVVNKYLVEDLKKLGLWNKKIKDQIILNDGSIQNINEIPDNIKEIYKTIWEIKQKDLIEMAIDRGYFVDQSQSMSLYLENPNVLTLSSLHFYGWKNGLKTGMYYLRTKPAAKTIKFTVESGTLANITVVCNGEVCKVCQ